jgi:hypothetical protein
LLRVGRVAILLLVRRSSRTPGSDERSGTHSSALVGQAVKSKDSPHSADQSADQSLVAHGIDRVHWKTKPTVCSPTALPRAGSAAAASSPRSRSRRATSSSSSRGLPDSAWMAGYGCAHRAEECSAMAFRQQPILTPEWIFRVSSFPVLFP